MAELVAPAEDEWGDYDDTVERCPACRRKWSKHWWNEPCTAQSELIVIETSTEKP